VVVLTAIHLAVLGTVYNWGGGLCASRRLEEVWSWNDE